MYTATFVGQCVVHFRSNLCKWVVDTLSAGQYNGCCNTGAVSSGPNFVESRKFKAASTSKECARPSYVVCPWSEMT